MTQSNNKLMQQQIKTILSALQEKDLKRVFERFLQISGEKIQKQCKEISYKCYQAVCSIRNKKSSGYGRNENQAITSSIRNLLDLMLEQERVVYMLKQCIKKCIDSYGGQDDKQNNITKIPLDLSKQYRKSSYKKPTPMNNILNNSSLNMSMNDQLIKSKSKISIDNIVPGLKLTHNLQKSITQEVQDQLKKARFYIQQLQLKLKSVTEENNQIKDQLGLINNNTTTITATVKKQVPICIQTKNSIDKIRSTSYQKESKIINNNTLYNNNVKVTHNQSFLQNNFMNTSVTAGQQPKKSKVPRLKLQVLPNYHGKSNKCLNQSLLAAYQQKHGLAASVKKY